EERIVIVRAAVEGFHARRVWKPVSALQTVRRQIRLVVERRRSPERADEKARTVVAMLHEQATGIDVAEVPAQRQLAAYFLRCLEPEAGPVVFVVGSFDDAVLIRQSHRGEESRPVIPARDLYVVVRGQAGVE